MNVKCILALRGCTKITVVLKQIFGPKKNEASESICNKDVRSFVHILLAGE
jgi:hypothetical protein